MPYSPLLDGPFLLALARQFSSARERLALRTAGNLPSAPELVVALRLYIARSDRSRLHTPSLPPPPASTLRPPPVPQLAYYLALAEAAYASEAADLEARLAQVAVQPPLRSVHESGKWAPGYYVARDMRYDCVVVAVRGSKELADVVTNLSAEVEPFLGGHGHQGVVKSAHNLHEGLRPALAEFVDRYEPSGGVVVVGHSLGGAVAAALTLLLRQPSLDREFDENNESERAKNAFRSARCFSFAPPPFLSEDLAFRSQRAGIVTMVGGFDVVPRLSAASLDRLLVAVSRYNWGRDVGESFGRTVQNVATAFLDPNDARNVSAAVVEHGVSGISLATGAIAHTARAALEHPQGSATRSPMWSLALNATAFVSSLVSDSLAGSHQRSLVDERRRPDYSFARHFGMSEDDIERVLVEDAPREVYLAGVVYHLDRPYTEATGQEVNLAELPRSTLVRRDCEFFRDVEPSSWMVHDHNPNFILSALETLQQ